MNTVQFEIPPKVKEWRTRADILRKKAAKLEEKAYEELENSMNQFIHKNDDKLLNRTQCLQHLPITTLESLKNWENRYSTYGYLRFHENKILRSELMRFIDDKQTGKLQQKIRKAG